MKSKKPTPESQVYLSGALAGAQDLRSRCQFYERFASMAAAKGVSVYLPHTKTHPKSDTSLSPQQVFDLDLMMIRRSSLLVAFLDVPSLGVGAEVALACQLGIPVLGTTGYDRATSRFIIGLLNNSRHGTFYQYHKLEDLIEYAASILKMPLHQNLWVHSGSGSFPSA